MNNTKKVQELKAHNVANDIFSFHMETIRFSDRNDREKLAILSEKAYTLNTVFQDKAFAQLVAKRILWIIEDYVKEQALCPGCFQGTEYRTTHHQTYWKPEEGELYCEDCGWKEAM